MSEHAGRKKEQPARITVEHVKDGESEGRQGGHIVEHHYDNTGRGESYRPPEKHVFTSHSALMAHLHVATGGSASTAPEVDEVKKEPTPKDAKKDAGADAGKPGKSKGIAANEPSVEVGEEELETVALGPHVRRGGRLMPGTEQALTAEVDRIAAGARIQNEAAGLTAIKASATAQAVIGDHVYDFYLCQRCGRLITQLELITALQRESGTKGAGQICRCGGLKISPAAPNVGMSWYHWLLPRVLKFTYLRLRGRA